MSYNYFDSDISCNDSACRCSPTAASMASASRRGAEARQGWRRQKSREVGTYGGIFTATLAPIGPSAAIVQGLGPNPVAFAQFQMNPDGKLGILRLTADDGQSYEFKQE